MKITLIDFDEAVKKERELDADGCISGTAWGLLREAYEKLQKLEAIVVVKDTNTYELADGKKHSSYIVRMYDSQFDDYDYFIPDIFVKEVVEE